MQSNIKLYFRGISRPQVFPIREANKNVPGVREEGSRARERFSFSAITSRAGSRVDDNFISATISATYAKGSTVKDIFNGTQKRTMIHTAYPGEVREYLEVSPTISTPSGGGHLPMVAQSLQTDGQLRQGTSWGTDNPQSSRNIRRLTPIECERLQGFPDNWTQKGIDKNGKEVMISDSQRYKCCGNAVTTNVITAIGQAFQRAYRISVGS